MNIAHSIKTTLRSVAKVVSGWVSGSGSKIAVGIRYALSMGTPGRWASDHREESMHFTGWNYVAIRALAIQAAQADVAVFADGPDPAQVATKRALRKSLRKAAQRRGKAYVHDNRSGTQLPPDDRLVKLMKRPNPTQSGALFRYEQIVQLQLTGSCIVWNAPNKLGLPVERYVIPTCMCYPVPPDRSMPRGGWKIDGTMNRFPYPLDADGFSEIMGMFNAMGYVIPAEQVQCIRWPHPIWKDDGYGPLAAGALWSDTAEQMDQSRWASLKQGPNPSLAVYPKADWNGDEDDLEEAQAKFNEKYAGAANSGKAMFVTAEKVEKLSQTAKEMDFVGSFPQSRECMLALHGTPPVAVGIAGDGSYAALYAGLKQYILLTVQPVLDMLAEDDTEHLFPWFGEGLTAEWTAAAIDDPQIDSADLATDIQSGCMTKGEYRAMRGWEPWGDARDEEIVGPPAPAPGAPGADGKPGQPGKNPFAKPVKPKKPAVSAGDKEEADEESTGVSSGVAPSSTGATPPKHFNRLMGDPVLKAAVEGALSGVGSHEEAVELAESWKWNGQQAV